MADRLDLQLISAALRRLGWVRFWAQLVLAVVVLGVLLFNNIGGQIGARADKALGLSPGLSLTSIAFFVLLAWVGYEVLVVLEGDTLISLPWVSTQLDRKSTRLNSSHSSVSGMPSSA